MNFKTAALLFLSAFFFFAIFTPNGHLPPDTAHSVATARSIVERGTFRLLPSPELIGTLRTADGSLYSKYGPGYAFHFVPVVVVAKAGSAITNASYETLERLLLCFVNAAWAALFLVLLAFVLVRLGYTSRTVGATLLVLGVGSILLPYSKILLVELPVAVLLLAGLLLLMNNTGWTPVQGLALGLVIAALYWLKAANLAYGAVLGGFIVWKRYRGQMTPGPYLSAWAGALLPLAPLFLVNAARFSSPFEFGYGAEQAQFTTPILSGLFGLIFSRAKSLFLYSPLILCACAAWPALFRRHRPAALLTALWLIIAILLHAQWHSWYGGWSWGPRLIVPALLVFHVGVAEFISRLKGRTFPAALFIVLLLVASGVQLLGTSVVYQQIHYFIADPADPASPHLQVAARLFLHKAKGLPEVYDCEAFDLDCETLRTRPPWSEVTRGGKLHFDDRRTYQGLNILWFGEAARNLGKTAVIIPLLLFLAAAVLLRAALKREFL